MTRRAPSITCRCYIANAMLLVHLWYAPTNVLLAKASGAGCRLLLPVALCAHVADNVLWGNTGLTGWAEAMVSGCAHPPALPPISPQVMFAHSMGPLLWSILAFRNSIVPHSLDKMTRQERVWCCSACKCIPL